MSREDHDDDGSSSNSGSDSEDIAKTGLIATRAKRSTAGNLYASLRANLDDEELQKELLAEDADDVGEYRGSDHEDDDAAFDSSSDEEDDNDATKQGQAADLSGEKELKKTERAEASRKRKARDARLKLPSWQKKKHVKIADDAKADGDSQSRRPSKKKAERTSWISTGVDGPTRQSNRALARASREITHAHLKQSYERSEKQRSVMKTAAEKEKATKRMDLTAEERLKRAAEIEKETKREFGRWEREEAERQRIRDELLAAKRQKGIAGPYMRYWSGSVMWQGNEIKVKRVLSEKQAQNNEQNEEEEVEERMKGEASSTTESNTKAKSKSSSESNSHMDKAGSDAPQNPAVVEDVLPDSQAIDVSDQPQIDRAQLAKDDVIGAEEGHGITMEQAASSEQTPQPTPIASTELKIEDAEMLDAPMDVMATSQAASVDQQHPEEKLDTQDSMLLAGIHEYAFESLPVPDATDSSTLSEKIVIFDGLQAPSFYYPSAPILHQTQILSSSLPSTSTSIKDHTTGTEQVSVDLPKEPTPPPLPIEQAQRCLLILDQFENLAAVPPPTRRSHKASSNLEPTSLAKILLPDSYPSFTPDEAKYLTVKPLKKRGGDVPPKTRCALTSWTAKYRDPYTGLAYADMHTYKIIQRILAGGCQWSSLLCAWVGPAYGPMGRPAHGVPEGFAGPRNTSVPTTTTDKVDAK